MPSLRSGGTVAPGYETVMALFLSHFEPDGQESSAQLTVYVKGRLVIDLWASKAHSTYGPDSLQNIFSSTKVLTSLVVALLVDRGHLRYDDRIADIWPEYAQHGKGGTTVEMLMRHEAGLATLDQSLEASDLTPEAIRSGAVSGVLAGQSPSHLPGESRECKCVQPHKHQ